MKKGNREIVVINCASCPLADMRLSVGTGWDCTVVNRRVDTQDPYPNWCPLLEGPITVVMTNKSQTSL